MTSRPNSGRVFNLLLRMVRITTATTLNLTLNPKAFKQKRKRDTLNLEDNPLVSIVVPTFNQSQYLDQCIESLLAQTYSRIQLIIVNDGSTDETELTLNKWSRVANVEVISKARNTGLPNALNTGFSKARGSLYTWVSSDNFLGEFAIESLVNFLVLNPRVDIAYSDFNAVDSRGHPIGRDFGWRNYDRITKNPSRLVMHNVTNPKRIKPINCVGAYFLMKSEVHRKIGGYKAPQGSEDYAFWLEASDYFCFGKSDYRDNSYLYRVHSESLTSKIQNKKVK